MTEIDSIEALIHLVLSREENGYIEFEEKFQELKSEPMEVLQEKACLTPAQDRFNQCYLDNTTKRFLMEIPVNQIYHYYFIHPAHKWPMERDFIITFAEQFFNDPQVVQITDFTIKNPRITVIQSIDESRYKMFDGMHRLIAYIKEGRETIPAVVIQVTDDFT